MKVLAVLAIALQLDPTALAPLYRQSLEESEKRFGAVHPKVARSASDLGLFLRNQGDRSASVEYLRRALDIDLKTLGSDHALTGEDLENLASVATPAEAFALYERAAAHKDPAIAARNLARLAANDEARGNRGQALARYREALAKEQSASGATHPRVAVRLNSVALLLEPPQAEPLLRRALSIQEKALGDHPDTATTLNNLANVLLATGNAVAAEPLLRRSLKILEEFLGGSHVRVATAASNLGDVVRERGKPAEARRLYERALAIDEKVYGPDHEEVAVDLEKLAGFLEENGAKPQAQQLMLRARRIRGVR